MAVDGWVGQRRTGNWLEMDVDGIVEDKGKGRDVNGLVEHVKGALEVERKLYGSLFGGKDDGGEEVRQGWSNLVEVFMVPLLLCLQSPPPTSSVREAANSTSDMLTLLLEWSYRHLPVVETLVKGEFGDRDRGTVGLTCLRNVTASLHNVVTASLSSIPVMITKGIQENEVRRDCGVWKGTSDVCAAVRKLKGRGKEIQIVLEGRVGKGR